MTPGSRKSASCRSSSTNSYSRVANHVGKFHKRQFKKKKIIKANGDRYDDGLTIGHRNQGSWTIMCDNCQVTIMKDDHAQRLSHDDHARQSCMTIITYDCLTWSSHNDHCAWSSQMIVTWWASLMIVPQWLSHMIFRHDHRGTIVVGQSCMIIATWQSFVTIMQDDHERWLSHDDHAWKSCVTIILGQSCMTIVTWRSFATIMHNYHYVTIMWDDRTWRSCETIIRDDGHVTIVY